VELCSRLDLDGLTPHPSRVRLARRVWGGGPGLVALLRPRPGDFHYCRQELHHMQRGLDHLAAAGADGVALGLVKDGSLDSRPLARLVEHARGLGLRVTFHRAFDALEDPLESLDKLVSLGVSRVLSSGTPWGSGQSAHVGLARLTAFQERSAGRLELVVAGGVDAPLISLATARWDRLPGTASWHAFSSVRRRGQLRSHLLADLQRAAR